MKTSIKIMIVLTFATTVLASVAQFASGNIDAGMADITMAIWMYIAYTHWKRAEEYRKNWLRMFELNLKLCESVARKEDDHAEK